MILKGNNEIREVYGIRDEEKSAILYFLQGAAYCWCKNRKNEWFSLRDLMGGDNFDWHGTPMYVLYEKHEKEGKENPVEAGGKDGGWLLKKAIHQDQRAFETESFEQIRKYRWIPEN